MQSFFWVKKTQRLSKGEVKACQMLFGESNDTKIFDEQLAKLVCFVRAIGFLLADAHKDLCPQSLTLPDAIHGEFFPDSLRVFAG